MKIHAKPGVLGNRLALFAHHRFPESRGFIDSSFFSLTDMKLIQAIVSIPLILPMSHISYVTSIFCAQLFKSSWWELLDSGEQLHVTIFLTSAFLSSIAKVERSPRLGSQYIHH